MKFIFFKFAIIFIAVLLCANVAAAQTETETGIGLYEKGGYEKAVESLQKAVKENEKDRQAWTYLGAALFRMKMTEKAVDAFQKAKNLPLPQTNESVKPIKIVSRQMARYTNKARQNEVRGTIAVAVEFGADGAINFVVPLNELPDGLTENVVQAVWKTKFEPATRDGKPVTVISFLEHTFSIY